MKELVRSPSRLDDSLLEELEALLLQADVGPGLTQEVIRSLSRREKGRAVGGWNDVCALVKEEMRKILPPIEASSTAAVPAAPEVILLVGVNGGGKTTTAGKLAARIAGDCWGVWLRGDQREYTRA